MQLVTVLDQSVSTKHLVLEIRSKTRVCEIKRHLAPKTVGLVMRSLPLQGRAHFLGRDIAYFEAGIDSGMERSRTEFKKGDVAFLPSSGSICFFLSDVSGKAMTLLGRLDKVDDLRDVKPGDVFRLYAD